VSCSRCGWLNAEDAQWCVKCGLRLERTAKVGDQAKVELSPEPLTLEAGGGTRGEVRVRNLGELVGHFFLRIRGPVATYATLEPNVVRLMPGGEATAALRIALPRSPEPRAGPMRVLVDVLRSDVPLVVGQGEGAVHIEPFTELVARIVPSRDRAWRGARYRVEVQNLGNADTRLSLGGEDPDDALTVAVAPEHFSLAPGEQVAAQVQVRARRWKLWGSPVDRPFTVALEGEGPRIERDAQLLQRALLTGKGLLLAVLALVVGVVAAGVLG
jgi:hypothetical protein